MLGVVLCAREAHSADSGFCPAHPSIGRALQRQRSALTQDEEVCKWYGSQNHCCVRGQGAGQIGGGRRLCHREKEDVWVGRSKGQGLEAETWEVCFGDPGLTV